MKQKTLPLLLIAPFAIAILSVLTIRLAVNIISEDIVDISWNFRANEGIKKDQKIELVASPVGGQAALDDPLNVLEWSVVNADEEDDTEYAAIEQVGNKYYLAAKEVGFTTVMVKNLRGTVSKSFNAHIYDQGVILINLPTSSSLGIENMRYFGQYDFDGDGQKNATVDLDIEIYPLDLKNQIQVKAISDGISYLNDRITIDTVIEKVEKKEITFSLGVESIPDQTYSFSVVKDGFNIYNYSQLLKATDTNNPKIVVQQVHFESLTNTYDSNGAPLNNDTVLYGTYEATSKSFNFANEVYRFETTYNHKYIDDWNAVNNVKVSKEVIAGLHIQKDFYGNGFKLNGHNLTYPTETTLNGDVQVATLGPKNLFRGPKTFVALGDPTSDATLVTAFGQDNTFLYVHGNDITLRDVNLRNADFGNNMNNLNYVGTGIDILGNNVTLLNSQVKNARNVIRVYSSMNTLIKNSLIATGRQALLAVGTNEFVLPDTNAKGRVYDADGNVLNNGNTLFSNYFRYPDQPITLGDYENQPTNTADGLITKYLLTTNDSGNKVYNAIRSLDALMNQESRVKDGSGKPIYKTEIEVLDTYFYQSGITSIMVETMFNGPFLHNALPSIISGTLNQLNYQSNINNVGGIAYPSKIKLSGNTRFYDYKKVKSIDVNSLISENISAFINQTFESNEYNLTVDDIFPVRRLIEKTGKSNNYILSPTIDGIKSDYINIPIVFYGGGVNLSQIDSEDLNDSDKLSNQTELDLLNFFLNEPNTDTITGVLRRSVLTATGFNNFKYYAYLNGFMFGDNPDINNLKRNVTTEV